MVVPQLIIFVGNLDSLNQDEVSKYQNDIEKCSKLAHIHDQITKMSQGKYFTKIKGETWG
jgi:hypothetical protein